MTYPHDDTPTETVLRAVDAERGRQDSMYGSQRHLPPERWLGVLAREFCEAGNEANEMYKGRVTDPAKLRTELVQLAAVAVAWVEALDAATTEAHADTQRAPDSGGSEPRDTNPAYAALNTDALNFG